MTLAKEPNQSGLVTKRSPRRYEFFTKSSVCSFNLSHSLDIRKKVTLETLVELAELTIENFKALLAALSEQENSKHDPQALFNECVRCYLVLLHDLEQFLGEGISVPETKHRQQQTHNARKAKVDYYFNWDKRIIAKAQTVSGSDGLNALATVGAALAMAIPMVINFLITLAPVEKAFKSKESGELIARHKTSCLEEKAKELDAIDVTTIGQLSVR